MAQYLVTGDAGFIGSNVAYRLLELKHNVRVLDNFLTGKRENLADLVDIDTGLQKTIRWFTD
jgi:nucleoside-diphosphate-sugar epimerase